MNVFKRIYTCPLFRNPKFLIVLWLGSALMACLLKLMGGKKYDVYIIYKNSFLHVLEELPLYNYYPEEYYDRFLYGISFSALMAPFSLFPASVGMVIWCLANSLFLYIAIRKFGLPDWKFAVVIWLCVNELFTSVLMQQFNIGIAAIILLSFVLIEQKKEFWAAFWIVLGTLTKLYGVVGLAFILFSKRKIVFLKGLVLWSVVFFLLPMLYASPGYVLGEYAHWFETLCSKDTENLFTDYTNISLLGMIRKISGVITYSDLWIIIPGILLFMAPYFRVSQYDHKQFRIHYLCSAILFMVLFSTSTENSGYIGAMVVVCLWYLGTPTRKTTPVLNTCLLIFCMILTSFSPTDIFPRSIRKAYVIPYALKALPCMLIWLKIVWEQLTQDFSEPFSLPTQKPKADSIDIILPCYNPHEAWEQVLIQKHTDLQAALPGRTVRLIVVNDGSAKGFTAEAIRRLREALPDTIIVDNPVNQGKGASVRSGLVYATSEIMLYTDYDFPYTQKSLLSVLQRLEEGYDVVIAVRNYTYYSNLPFMRKVMSSVSQFLNFFLLGLTHPDTQGGLKGFNRKGKALLASTQVNRFLFDTEFIYKASLEPGVLIKDVPADLRSNVHLPNMRRGVLWEEVKNLFRIAI